MTYPIWPAQTFPIFRAFVLSREGELIYSSSEVEHVKARLFSTLLRKGYPVEVIEGLKLLRVNPESLNPVFKAHHPHLRDEYFIHTVDWE